MHTKRLKTILPLAENMNGAMTFGKYEISIMADLEGAFDSVWREGGIYKLYKAGITNNNLLLILTSFLKHRQYRNLIDTHTGNWSNTTSGIPQGSILSPLIVLVYTADMSAKEVNTIEH